MTKPKLTKHIRHARLVKIVRRQYQLDNPGSRLFNNTSGVAYQGTGTPNAGKVTLINPRPVFFGIPNHNDGSGGADLLGWTMRVIFSQLAPEDNGIPIFTAVEVKTGKARLQKNQKIFRLNIKKANGIYYLARECPECYDKWEPIYKNGKLIEWEIPPCDNCGGKGFMLEE